MGNLMLAINHTVSANILVTRGHDSMAGYVSQSASIVVAACGGD